VDDDVDQLSADRHHWRAQNMGQLLTLMVFGDAITIDNDDADDDEIGAATPGPGRGSPEARGSATLRSAAAGWTLPPSEDARATNLARTGPGSAPENNSDATCPR